ncbi:Conserved protein of unknown function [Mycobacterium canettii CIPT 140070010]|nr:Conserved protein of unknown function [Mycobacterium canettii CIPT 140070010]
MMRLSAAKAAERIAPCYRILARYIIANICQFALLFTDQLSKQSRIGYGHQRSLPRTLTNVTDCRPVRGASVRHLTQRPSIESSWCAAPW